VYYLDAMTLQKRRLTNLFLLALPVFVLFNLSFIATLWWWYQGLPPENTVNAHILLFTIMHISWLVVLYLFQLLDLRTYRGWQWIYRLVWAMGLSMIVGAFIFYLQPNLLITPRRMLVVHVVFSSGLVLLWGMVATWAMARRRPLHILFMSVDLEATERFSELANQQRYSIRCTHISDAHDTPLDEFIMRKPDILCLPDVLPTHYQSIVQEAREKNIPIYTYTTLYEEFLRRIAIDELQHISGPNTSPFMHLHLIMKRLIDLVMGLLIGIVVILTAPIIIPLIKLSSPGPVLFLQKRVTLDGKTFTIYKYRTMRTQTDTSQWTQKNDPRVTKIGAFLRRSHLDELPQAWNLIKGDLSLVGPRPEQEVIVEKLNNLIPFYTHRHRVRSGLTGWAQLQGYTGSMVGTHDKLEYDLYYLKHQSLLFDLEIILKTLRSLVRLSGR
jgi:exopolysaccharide biosynthesis polyprenyl glycosylphosphotransferase